jgi:DNA-directed RNA polymerase subunit RPC12/RpoP
VHEPLCTLDSVNAAAPQEHDVVCPHCKKRFTASLLPGAAAERYRGYKCPHCKLFVPAQRASTGR